MAKQQKDKKYLFDDPRNVRRLLGIFYVSLGVLLGLELFVHKHPHFKWEEWFGFYAIYGLVSCILLVLIAKYILRPLIMRDEDYYDE
ncbi:hypothetical protein [Geoalkalibacter subterraneus]|uniref:Uncharacterized protein n=1 Tax=Geoalkalibacter subterraneus TaxID=483547 RepID=A0A0B5FDG9_9BACT|nr:hypothetical protein [Geoalkalibacter subterraneus]AJF05348.1 hypothetical protein GSUB_00400 [Geoalkalibacter subterraneus]